MQKNVVARGSSAHPAAYNAALGTDSVEGKVLWNSRDSPPCREIFLAYGGQAFTFFTRNIEEEKWRKCHDETTTTSQQTNDCSIEQSRTTTTTRLSKIITGFLTISQIYPQWFYQCSTRDQETLFKLWNSKVVPTFVLNWRHSWKSNKILPTHMYPPKLGEYFKLEYPTLGGTSKVLWGQHSSTQSFNFRWG